RQAGQAQEANALRQQAVAEELARVEQDAAAAASKLARLQAELSPLDRAVLRLHEERQHVAGAGEAFARQRGLLRDWEEQHAGRPRQTERALQETAACLEAAARERERVEQARAACVPPPADPQARRDRLRQASGRLDLALHAREEALAAEAHQRRLL